MSKLFLNRNATTLLLFKAYGRMDSQQVFLDWSVTKISKVWGSARVSSARRSSATNSSDPSEDSTLCS